MRNVLWQLLAAGIGRHSPVLVVRPQPNFCRAGERARDIYLLDIHAHAAEFADACWLVVADCSLTLYCPRVSRNAKVYGG